MELRPVTIATYADIDRIWKEHHSDNFGLPNLNNVVTKAVVEHNNKVVAFGYVKLLAEAILVLDLSESKKTKVQAVQHLMLEAIRGSKQHDLTQLHTFVKRDDFSKFLIKHYDFQEVKDKTLVLNL